MSTKKIVFGFETTVSKEDQSKILPVSELSEIKFRQSLSSAFDYLKTFEGIHGLRPEMDFRPSRFASDELELFLQHLCRMPETLRDTRVIIADTEIEVCQIDGNGKALFVISSGETPTYDFDRDDQTKFSVEMRPSWMGKFIFDYFVELYIANSIPAVKRFLDDEANGGLPELYRRKNNFIQKELAKGSIPDVFQSGRSPAQYACFHNSVRETRELFTLEQTKRAVILWDQFVVEELSAYLTNSSNLREDIKGWKRVHGQISKQRLLKRLGQLSPGAYLIFKQRRSSQVRKTDITSENVRTVIEGWSRKSNLNKGFAIIGAEEIRADQRARLIHRLIDSEYLQTYRIWVT